MNLKGFNEAQNHKNVLKTEGYLLTKEDGSTRQIKKIEVNQRILLSLQMHFYKTENLVILK